MVAAAVIIGVGTAGAAAVSANAAKQAGKSSQAGYDAASRESARQYDQTRKDQQPWMQTGKNALNLLGRASGTAAFDADAYYNKYKDSYLAEHPGDQAFADYFKNNTEEVYRNWGDITGRPADTTGTNGQPDLSAFTASPGYQFRLQQGTNTALNAFSAKGGAQSGNALKALNDYAQGQASAEYGNWWNQIAGLAGVGQSATNTVAQAGAQNSQNVQNNLIGSANARASGIQQQGDIYGGAINSLAGNAAAYGMYKKPTTAARWV